MNTARIVALAGISLLAMSNSCEKEGDAAPGSELATGRVVRTEITTDDQFKNPRPRWEIDVAPLSFPGLTAPGAGAMEYQQVKVFNLPDTATYKAGRTIRFRYRLVPQNEHTPWRTFYERMNMAPGIAWGDRLPELALTDVQLVPAPAAGNP